MISKDGSPFGCGGCGAREREERNCFNHKGLSEGARAVTEYTAEVTEEHRARGAGKVFRLGEIRLYECPVSYISAETVELMRLVYLIDGSGVLLHPGGWGAQPLWLVEAYEIYRAENAKRIREKRDG